MTEPESTSDDEHGLDPRQEARLRRLLARARHDEPMPDDVAARLDRVLADLAHAESAPTDEPTDEPTGRPTDGPTEELATRRRRVVGLLLAAAAFVAVAGVGVHALRGDPTSSDAATSDSASGDNASEAPSRPRAESLTGDASGRVPGPAAAPFGTQTSKGLPDLTDARFSDQVRRLVRVAGPASGAAQTDGTTGRGAERCRLPARVTDDGSRTLSVVYRDAPAALVVRPRQGQSQVVDLVRCGSGQVLRSVTLAR